ACRAPAGPGRRRAATRSWCPRRGRAWCPARASRPAARRRPRRPCAGAPAGRPPGRRAPRAPSRRTGGRYGGPAPRRAGPPAVAGRSSPAPPRGRPAACARPSSARPGACWRWPPWSGPARNTSVQPNRGPRAGNHESWTPVLHVRARSLRTDARTSHDGAHHVRWSGPPRRGSPPAGREPKVSMRSSSQVSDQQRSALTPTNRAEHLSRLGAATAQDPLDVLVVGGGVNGAGAAFDAATRGLTVGLVETHDWASGTSSRSSKLMHGGLRYLQMLDFTLVAEALRERDLLLEHTAPHLVKPIKFVFPFFKKVVDRAFIGSGVALYDAMQSIGRKRAVPFHRHLLHDKMLEVFPALDGEKAVGALEYYDAQMDDARFVMMLVRSAAQHDAAVANYTTVVDYLREGTRVIGARVRDEETGE